MRLWPEVFGVLVSISHANCLTIRPIRLDTDLSKLRYCWTYDANFWPTLASYLA